MKNKMKNKKGFTLMEMLIVVAIMVVLVAVAVPTFSKQLTSAKTAADDANMRSAKAVAATTYLANDNAAGKYYFHATDGKLDKTNAPAKDYGKSGKNRYIEVEIQEDGTIIANWVLGS